MSGQSGRRRAYRVSFNAGWCTDAVRSAVRGCPSISEVFPSMERLINQHDGISFERGTLEEEARQGNP